MSGDNCANSRLAQRSIFSKQSLKYLRTCFRVESTEDIINNQDFFSGVHGSRKRQSLLLAPW